MLKPNLALKSLRLIALFFLLTLAAWPSDLVAVTFCVDDSSDGIATPGDCDTDCTDGSNNCSLRDAITAANGNNNDPTVDSIIFNIPGAGVHTIFPTGANNDLPDISDPVFIDGYSQPGSSMNSLSDGSNAVILIEIDGTQTIPGTVNGLALQAGSDGSTIRGLAIHTFTSSSIRVQSQNNTIVGNFLGTIPSGTAPPPAPFLSSGLLVFSSNNQVGGTLPEEKNLISGNIFGGVIIFGTGSDDNIIEGNLIGTDLSGTLPLPNGLNGIRISEDANNNLVGGTDPASANIIAFNSGSGISVSNSVGNTLLGNSIFSNTGNQGFAETGMGIELGNDEVTLNDLGDADIGSNGLQNFPELSSAIVSDGSITLMGILNSNPNNEYRVEFFINDDCDPSGHGEGQTLLGFLDPLATDGSGNASIDISLPSINGVFLTATATDLSTGDTSEFSSCIQISTPEDICSDGTDNDGDGQIDCEDSDCMNDVECMENGEEICGNGVDDDGDNAIDCNDPDCSTAASCNSAQISGSGCSLNSQTNFQANNRTYPTLLMMGILGLFFLGISPHTKSR